MVIRIGSMKYDKDVFFEFTFKIKLNLGDLFLLFGLNILKIFKKQGQYMN
jgi:hypothetical protein